MSSWQPLVRQKDATVIATGPVIFKKPHRLLIVTGERVWASVRMLRPLLASLDKYGRKDLINTYSYIYEAYSLTTGDAIILILTYSIN